jgi:hypothetical protein
VDATIVAGNPSMVSSEKDDRGLASCEEVTHAEESRGAQLHESRDLSCTSLARIAAARSCAVSVLGRTERPGFPVGARPIQRGGVEEHTCDE